MTVPEPAEVDCAVCQTPCVVVPMRDGDSVLADAIHRTVGIVLNQHGQGLRVTRVYTEHSRTCASGRRKKR